MTFLRGCPYLPGVEEFLPPVLEHVLFPLQEAQSCATEAPQSWRLCAITHESNTRIKTLHLQPSDGGANLAALGLSHVVPEQRLGTFYTSDAIKLGSARIR